MGLMGYLSDFHVRNDLDLPCYNLLSVNFMEMGGEKRDCSLCKEKPIGNFWKAS